MQTKRFTKLLAIWVGLFMLAIPLSVYAQSGNGNGGNWGNNRGQNQSQMQSNMQSNQVNRQAMGNCIMMDCPYGLQNLPAVSSDVQLSDEVVAAMTAGIMDEYNAYAIYQTVIDQFGSVRPFTRIQAAEAQHIAAWEFLFERYSLDVPTMPETDTSLTFTSLSDACTLAASAEVANFGLYDEMLNTLSDYPDMVQVVTSLRNASEFNHLPAFERCAG